MFLIILLLNNSHNILHSNNTKLLSDLPEFIRLRSGLALVDGQPWDMHRPLVKDCTLEFLHFSDFDPDHINKVLSILSFIYYSKFLHLPLLTLILFQYLLPHSYAVYQHYFPNPFLQFYYHHFLFITGILANMLLFVGVCVGEMHERRLLCAVVLLPITQTLNIIICNDSYLTSLI